MHGAIAEVLYLEGPHLGGLTGSRLGALYVVQYSRSTVLEVYNLTGTTFQK